MCAISITLSLLDFFHDGISEMKLLRKHVILLITFSLTLCYYSLFSISYEGTLITFLG